MLTILLIALFASFSLLASIGGLWLGARWAEIAGVTKWRLAGVIGLFFLVNLALAQGFSALEDAVLLPQWIEWLGELAVTVTIYLFVISRVLRTSMVRAVLPLLGVFAAGLLALALVFGLVRPYLLEAFVVPISSAAPSVTGPHWVVVCPRCGGNFIVPYDLAPPYQPEGTPVRGICANCLQTNTVTSFGRDLLPADRVVSNKLLTPRRWDLVTVRPPDDPDPSHQYVKRLIGLPSEELVIKDEQAWINEKRLQPPSEISTIRFTPTFGSEADALWGSPARPAKLGPGEYFVVGDFAEFSKDSRTWGKPIVQSDITGVVSAIYYPVSRWRIFR
jgi:signal peptidase I